MKITESMDERFRNVLFYGIVILLAYLLYLIFEPFLAPLAWAAISVVVSYPVYVRFRRRWSPTIASAMCTILLTLVLVVPTLLISVAFVRQAISALKSIHPGFFDDHFIWANNLWAKIQTRYPDLADTDLPTLLEHYAAVGAAYVGSKLGTILRHLAEFFFHLGVMILATFYLYRDGHTIVARLRDVLPFHSNHREDMIGTARDLIVTSVTSSLISAVAHGVFGALIFFATGIQNPIFWGVMMGFFSLVPVVGSALVWVPLAISLAASGNAGRAAALLLGCIAIALLVDNLLRPWLISGRSELSGLVVFISVLGGITVFGLLGIVLGPIIAATAFSVLDLYAPDQPAGNKKNPLAGKKPHAVLE